MSIEEQDRLYGQLTREGGEVERAIAGIKIKLRTFAEQLKDAQKHVEQAASLSADGNYSEIPGSVADMPNKEELLAHFEEMTVLIRKHDEIQESLKAMDR